MPPFASARAPTLCVLPRTSPSVRISGSARRAICSPVSAVPHSVERRRQRLERAARRQGDQARSTPLALTDRLVALVADRLRALRLHRGRSLPSPPVHASL